MKNEEVIQYDITINCGSDYAIDFETLEDDDSYINVESFSVESQLREFAESDDKISFTCTADGTGFHLSMPHDTTAKIPYTQGEYDVFIIKDGHRTKFAEGRANIITEVTR